ncbi:MAG: aldo/keto reductase [Rhodobacteraceae bacterium]|nr:aldo/keto reductase [Paracoccaceae bacterium]
MRKLTLGRNGPRVPEFCLGTMTFGRQTPEAEAHRQLDLARAHGLTFLDSAEMYPVNPVSADTLGGSEAIIGSWIAARGIREKLVIATKVTGKGGEVIPGGAPPVTPARLRSGVEASLRRLGVDCIDLYQIHWPDRGSYHFRRHWSYRPATDAAPFRDHVRAVLTEAEALIAEGKIGQFGLSNETAWGLSQWLRVSEEDGLPRVCTIQNEYSLLCRLFDTDLAETSAMEDVSLLGFSPLGTGLLTGKYAGDVTPDGSRRENNPSLGGRVTPRAFEAVAAYRGLALDWGLDPVVMALAWFRTRPFMALPILGATTEAQLQAMLPALETTLPDELVAAIDRLHRAHPLPF